MSKRFLLPQYWPIWLFLAIVRCIVYLPYAWQLKMGRVCGFLLYKAAKRRRHIARVNINLCFPELSSDERTQLVRRHFESLGVGIVEMALAWWGSESQLRQLTQIEGLQNLQQALDKRNGVILLSAHFTSFELGGRLLSFFAPFCVMYRRNENPVLEEVTQRVRTRLFGKAIPRDNVREMMRALKEGAAIWYASDQNYGHKYSVFAPFFNIPAATNTAVSRIASSGAAVVPFFVERLKQGAGYRLMLLPPLENFPSGDLEADAARVNGLIEGRVRRVPEQYFWAHRRFKDRPPGEPDVYA